MSIIQIIFSFAVSCCCCGLFISCGKSLLGPDPDNTPESNFEILSRDFQNVYPFFEERGINWDSLYSLYRKQVNSATDESRLYGIMSSMLSSFKDGHINLKTPLGVYHYEDNSAYPHNFTNIGTIRRNYLKSIKQTDSFTYGHISDNIGYIYIPDFESDEGQNDFEYIDHILEEFKDLRSIIIDIRDNYGGKVTNAKTVASRFADRKHLYVYSRWKLSSARDDFSGYTPEYIEPAGKLKSAKPVAVLTNRRCYSSAEHFVFAMKTFPDVTIIGDTTGGVMGFPVYRELPNGWKYMLPRSIQYDNEKRCYEAKGIPPDIPLWISSKDIIAGKDRILELAISNLKRTEISRQKNLLRVTKGEKCLN